MRHGRDQQQHHAHMRGQDRMPSLLASKACMHVRGGANAGVDDLQESRIGSIQSHITTPGDAHAHAHPGVL